MNPSSTLAERAHISADGQTLELALRIADADVVGHARAGGLGDDDPVAVAKSLYRLGVIVTTTSRLDATVAEARRMHESLTALGQLPEKVASRVGARLGEQLAGVVGDKTQAGALQQAIDASVTQGAQAMRAQLKPVVDQLIGAGPDALPQLVDKRLRSALTDGATAFQRQLFASDSPLIAQLKQHTDGMGALRREVAELRKELTAQITQLLREQLAAQSDPATAGRDWEPATLDAVANLTSLTGDRLEITGDQPGHGRVKKGDGVLHLPKEGRIAGLRVAIECRTGTTKRVSLKDMEVAMENRAAHAGLLLAEHPQGLPRDAQKLGFRIYPDDGVVVAHYDPTKPESRLVLAAAIQIVRSLARLAALPGDQSAMERDLLRTVSQRINAAFAQIRPLRAAATGVERELGHIRECANEIHKELAAAITDLASLNEAA